MFRKTVNVLGMELEQWRHKSCTANFGVGSDWATLYDIKSSKEGRGYATKLLAAAQKHYEDRGKKFGGSIALNERMKKIYERLKIKEYHD